MAVSGGYMAWRIPYAIAPIRAYGEFLEQDILPQFENLSARADAVADEEFARLGSQPADGNSDVDMGALAEVAEDKGIEFYATMTGLRYGMVGLFATGLFHMVEQQLASLCQDGAFNAPPPKKRDLRDIGKWYRRYFRLELSTLPEWDLIDELRLVANTVKHAEGDSAKKLRQRRPTLFHNPVVRQLTPPPSPKHPIFQPLAGEDLFVTDTDLKQYVGASIRLFEELADHFEKNFNEPYGP
jgi:hypothetical protein